MKCSFKHGIKIKPNGIDELDPCVYQDIEMHTNVTVIVSRCKYCGNVDIRWLKQDDTETIFNADT